MPNPQDSGPPIDIETRCALPGAEGAFWRLIKTVDLEKVETWLRNEGARPEGIPLDHIALAFGQALSVLMLTVARTVAPNDPLSVLRGRLLPAFVHTLEQQSRGYDKRTERGLILPQPGDIKS